MTLSPEQLHVLKLALVAFQVDCLMAPTDNKFAGENYNEKNSNICIDLLVAMNHSKLEVIII
jgi:hypothetical protein